MRLDEDKASFAPAGGDSLNQTPRGERVHIAIFGRRNVGKSSLINALTGQDVAIVSAVKGTTTDPVFKAMELLPLGPVVLIDTPGLDDTGELGAMRVQRARDVLNKTDVALLVTEAEYSLGDFERQILELIRAKNIPLIVVFNKCDLTPPSGEALQQAAALAKAPVYAVSSLTADGVENLKLALARIVPEESGRFELVGDLLSPADIVVLVTPIDKAAPKGRLILPQQQAIRDILEADAIAVVTKEHELRETLSALNRAPRLVITDSQAFAKVAADTPRDVPLTSFSILFARYKGDLTSLVRGTEAVETLKDGDRVLISEGCTHHRQSDDIGTVKLPRWLRQHTGKRLVFEHTSGMKYPRDLKSFALVVHCGACMLNRREMHYRIHLAAAAGVPITNYGVLIAYMQGILARCLEPLRDLTLNKPANVPQRP
ncbi:MAG: [FeFe] hydrogenase H-cluster maturation GTPase HydF [Kiritimatiellae bacterium]|nr:[FeFe] hydrogenase H-cluster maturation GTPase HydF [Kiritimatiellia bacterium]